MRKNVLALSIAASIGSLAGFANAAVIDNTSTLGGGPAVVSDLAAAPNRATTLAINPNGVGHVLVVPYFTTQGSKQTLLNLVNTDTVNGKAVKLRYRGAANSDDVFDITVYLSPGDVFTGTVTANGNVSRFLTSDTSCTIPFRADLAANGNFPVERVRNNDPLQTREGYIEILNTADIPPQRIAGNAAVTSANPLFDATKHAIFGAPTCAPAVMNLQRADLTNTVADANNWRNRGYAAPTGGLMANWTIVDLALNSTSTGSALALRANTAGGASGVGNLVWFPQTTDPVVDDINALTSDPLLTTGQFKTTNATGVAHIAATMQDLPDLSTPYTGVVDAEVQASRLTAAIAVTNVSNEYITDGNFSTDWLLSMPTRRYSVAANYAAAGAAAVVFNPSLRSNTDRSAVAIGRASAGVPGAGVVSLGSTGYGWFRAGNTSWDATRNQICVTPGSMTTFDREENEAGVFSVSPGGSLRLCGETNVISFNNKASVLGATLTRSVVTVQDVTVPTRWQTGWATLATNVGAGLTVSGAVVAATAPAAGAPGSAVAIGDQTSASPGTLPIVGFAAVAFSGNNLGGAWVHRAR